MPVVKNTQEYPNGGQNLYCVANINVLKKVLMQTYKLRILSR